MDHLWLGIIQRDLQQRGGMRDFKFYISAIEVPSTNEYWSNRYLPENAIHSEGCGYIVPSDNNSKFHDKRCENNNNGFICEWWATTLTLLNTKNQGAKNFAIVAHQISPREKLDFTGFARGDYSTHVRSHWNKHRKTSGNFQYWVSDVRRKSTIFEPIRWLPSIKIPSDIWTHQEKIFTVHSILIFKSN